MRKRTGNRWVVVAIFGALFVALFVIVGVADGIGHPSVPSGAVAVVEDAPDGTISNADFDAALTQAAAQQQQPKPKPSDPGYATLRDAAMSSVLLSRWIMGEAEERGITISDTEISNQLKQIAQQPQFGGQKQFRQGIKQLGYTLQQARGEVERSLITNEIEKDVVPQKPSVSESEITTYYEDNKSQFSQPETRDVREIVNSDQAKVEQAKAALEKDSSPQSWKQVAAKYSTDQATKDSGGLRQGVTVGQSEPTVDKEIFAAAQGQLIGPIKGQKNYYLIQVDKITPAVATPLSKVSSQIRQQLAAGIQQQVGSDFQTDFIDKWTQRSFCADGYVIDRCANFTPQDTCTGDDPGESGNLDKSGCDAFVPSIAPVAPGQATVFSGQPVQGTPQGPVPAGGAAVQQPSIIGPGGAPQLPPGAAPPQTAPPQTAPPQTAPPQSP